MYGIFFNFTMCYPKVSSMCELGVYTYVYTQTSMKIITQNCRGMYGWQCHKPQTLGVWMAVRRQDRTYKEYTSNPIPTHFFLLLHTISVHRLKIKSCTKKIGNGVICTSVLPAHCMPHLQLVSVVFGTAISTSLYINFLEDVFCTCLCVYFSVQ